jgi:magnesium-transporting ATPase (P-type)
MDKTITKPGLTESPIKQPHTLDCAQILSLLSATTGGLTSDQVTQHLLRYGANTLPSKPPPGLFEVFMNQFRSPLIYVLVAAAAVSLLIGELSDAIFIAAVLLLNAGIGTMQEFSAQRSASALQKLMTTRVRVLRNGDTYEVDSKDIVPGDIVLLESGNRVPADMRIIDSHDLEIDESLLTGESLAVSKQANVVLAEDTVLGDRSNMVFAGSLVNRGRASCVVVGTGLVTELGKIAEAVSDSHSARAPLQIRMERFTQRVAIFVGCAVLLMASILLFRGMSVVEIFLSSVALAVSVIPEGLPVALTVALAIGMRRMSRRDVIVRRLIAVEALGSCTYIASDKTGTLTANQLTARRLKFPGEESWQVTGDSSHPNGEISTRNGVPQGGQQKLLDMACQCAVLANEGFLGHNNGDWVSSGDAVDVALLIMAHRVGWTRGASLGACPEIDVIPFESERLFSASANRVDGKPRAFVKGALEKLLPMCDWSASADGDGYLDSEAIEAEARELAAAGYRVIAMACGDIELADGDELIPSRLAGLTLIGMVGLIDPLRPEAKSAIARCRAAGIQVAMVTGDHPLTAFTIGRELGLLQDESQLITGPQLSAAADQAEIDRMTRSASVFARVEPGQKLDIVESLQRNGHYVAVSGDGANDAPALRAAQVGVAMGRSGTDVARETADIIITDDNFESIVDGVEQGRIAYANVRKVIFLLVSTGAAELVLFVLAMLTALPLPLVAVQLLWLNLVTNGIQDIALAFEPGEGHELQRPPRSPRESIFNRIMLERVIISAVVMGVVAFALFSFLLDQGFDLEQARNSTLLLMVLFENVHVFNCRSESLSVFRHNPLRNKLLLVGTLIAQLVHIGSMYTPWLGDVLGVHPVSFLQWLGLLALAFSVMLVMELHKGFRSAHAID